MSEQEAMNAARDQAAKENGFDTYSDLWEAICSGINDNQKRLERLNITNNRAMEIFADASIRELELLKTNILQLIERGENGE